MYEPTRLDYAYATICEVEAYTSLDIANHADAVVAHTPQVVESWLTVDIPLYAPAI